MKANHKIAFLALSYILFVFFPSCSSLDKQKENLAFATYQQVIDYTLEHKLSVNNGNKSGRLYGGASFSFHTKSASNSGVKISYDIPGIGSDIEDGDLSDWAIKKSTNKSDGDASQVYISARWQPHGSGGGTLQLTVSTDNVVKIAIFGDGNWQYWTHVKVDSAKEVIEMLESGYHEQVLLERNHLGPNGCLRPNSLYLSQNNEGEGYLITDEVGTTCNFWFIKYEEDGIDRYVYKNAGPYYISEKGRSFMRGKTGAFDNPFIVGDNIACKIDEGEILEFTGDQWSGNKGPVFKYIGDDTMMSILLACPPRLEENWLIGTWRRKYDSYTKENMYFFADGHYEEIQDNGKIVGKGFYTVYKDYIQLIATDGIDHKYYYKPGEWISTSTKEYAYDRRWLNEVCEKISWTTPGFKMPESTLTTICPYGRWIDESGEVLSVVKSDGRNPEFAFLMDVSSPNGRYSSHPLAPPKENDGKFSCTVIDDLHGYDLGEIVFDSEDARELIWTGHAWSLEKGPYDDKYYRHDSAPSHGEVESKARQQAIQILVENARKLHQDTSRRKIANHPWIVGKWMDEYGECITISEDGLVNSQNGVTIGAGTFKVGETVYHVDWESETIISEYGNVFKPIK